MRYGNLIEKMSLEEKARLCIGKDFWHTTGVERLGIPEIMMSDGPHGLRFQANEADELGIHKSEISTCFPGNASAKYKSILLTMIPVPVIYTSVYSAR